MAAPPPPGPPVPIPASTQLAVQFHKSRYANDDTIGYAVFMGVQSSVGGGIDNGVFGPGVGGGDLGAAPLPEGHPLPADPAFPKGSYYILAVYENSYGAGGVGTFQYADPAAPPAPPASGIVNQLANDERITFYAVAAFTNLQGAINAITRANALDPPPDLENAIRTLRNASTSAGAAGAAPGSLNPIINGDNFNLWYMMNGRRSLELHLQSTDPVNPVHVYDIVLQLYHGLDLSVINTAPLVQRLNEALNLDGLATVYADNNPNALTITLTRKGAEGARVPNPIRGGDVFEGIGSTPQYSIGGGRYKTSRTYKKKRSNKNKKNKNDTRK